MHPHPHSHCPQRLPSNSQAIDRHCSTQLAWTSVSGKHCAVPTSAPTNLRGPAPQSAAGLIPYTHSRSSTASQRR
ncbi:hypothetical protein LX36DRAFT_657353 [Colletotrichum falcatum]|nr:hypothetical protein LX36DRAFT_657353 [Colletotrichum falcatum]